MKKILALLLTGTMIFGTLTGCGKSTTETPAGQTDGAVSEEGNTDSGNTPGETPLVVGYLPFSEKFSPFFHDTEYDKDVTLMTQTYLLTLDRSGAVIENAIEGETTSYNGTEYTYYGPANISFNYDEAKDETVYNIKLRDDVKFSDGEVMDADDIIFNLYVYCDSSYDGSTTIFSRPIKGLKNYRANSTAADSITSEEVSAVVKEMPEALAAQIKENIIVPTLTSELEWCATLYDDESYKEMTEQYPETKDLFASFYSIDSSYDSSKAADEKQVLSDIIEAYGTDYKALGKAYAGDEDNYDADVRAMAEAYVIEQKKEAGEGEEVPNIEGIKKISDTEIEVVTDGYDATMIYQFEIEIAPLHYYGDTAQYDYENNKFGFPRGDLSIVKEKTTKPMGSGPYKFQKYENKVVYFEANENYYLGAPKTKYVQFKESIEADKIPGVEQGTIDISDPSGSKAAFENIKSINGGELSGDRIVVSAVDNLGYGYIGINARTVKVGDDAASEASKNLRKALATIMAVYRDVAIDTYYGDAASVIQYPISNTSWAAPQKSDADYHEAYSLDVDGNPIYTEGMSADEKYASAIQAALGYFEAAGYTVADGKVTAAPAGAKMEYEIIIPADGIGDHPSFSVLTDSAEALKSIGITLTINDPSDPNVLWDKIDTGTHELWTAAWQATVDPDMYQTYHSDNVIGGSGTADNRYDIMDPELDELILTARKSDDQAYRKSIYKQCLDIIMDWGVELPVYQRQNCVIFSAERVNMDTVTKDLTPFYKLIREMANIEMK